MINSVGYALDEIETLKIQKEFMKSKTGPADFEKVQSCLNLLFVLKEPISNFLLKIGNVYDHY